MVWRGPRAKYQVTLSVRPSTWQAPHEPHAAPVSDQRPRPVLKKRLPRSTASAAFPRPGAARSRSRGSPAAVAGDGLRAEVDRRDVARAVVGDEGEGRGVAMAMPMGRRIRVSAAVRRSMKMLLPPTAVMAGPGSW